MGRPGDPPGAVDDLVPVEITVDPDGVRWHAVHDPARDLLLGPRSSHHRTRLQEDYHLVGGHLTKGSPVGLCGRPAALPELAFHRPHWLDGLPRPDLPDIDLFAGWATGTVCRECLLATL